MNWNNLFKHGVLVDINIRFWLGAPSEDISKFRSIEGKARRHLDHNSFLFPIGSSRFVLKKMLPGVLGKLKEFRQDYIDAVDVFFKENKDLIHYKPRFSLGWSVFTVSPPPNIAGLEEERDRTDNLIREFIETAVLQLRSDIEKNCKNMLRHIEGSLTFKGPSMKSLKVSLQKFMDLDFVGDEDVMVLVLDILDFLKRYPTKRIQGIEEIRSAFVYKLIKLSERCLQDFNQEIIDSYVR